MNESPDDELMARLRAADPLPDLPAVRPERLDQLLEATMTSTATTPTTRRPRALLLAASAAAVVAVGVGGGALYLTAQDGGTTTLALAPGGGPAAICAQITPDTLAGNDVAFAGRVTSISGGVVTLETTQRFAGDVGDTVEVTQGEGSVVDGAPITFEQGQSYLLTADGGTIGSCSGSGPDTPELRTLFDEAFGG